MRRVNREWMEQRMIYIKMGKNKYNASQLLFDITLLMWTSLTIIFNYTTLGEAIGCDLLPLLYYVNRIALVFLLIKAILMTRYNKRQLIINIIILGVTIMTYYQSGSVVMLVLAMFLVASKDVDLNITFQRMCKWDIVLLCFIVSFSLAGIIPNRMTGVTSSRSSLGFLHPNNFGSMIINVILLVMYLNWGDLKARHWIVIAGLIGLDFMYPKSKTAYFIIVLIVALYIVGTKIPGGYIKRFLRTLLKWMPAIILAATVTLTYMYINEYSVAVAINELFTTRIYQMSFYWQNYSITLFGQHLNTVSSFEANSLNAMHALDNSYLNILLGSGAIIFVLLIGSLLFLAVRSAKVRDYKMACIVACIFFWGFMETSIYKLEFNSMILLIGTVLYNNYRIFRKAGEKEHG